MSPTLQAAAMENVRFPRVSGDEPGASLIDWAGALFSPRERG